MPPKLPELTKEKAAYLASRGKSRSEIRDKLGISEASVTRLLREAYDTDKILINAPPELNLRNPALEGKLERELFGEDELFSKLRGKSKQRLKMLRVFDVSENASIGEGFSSAAADFIVVNYFTKSTKVAVTWGATITSLVDAVQKAAPLLRPHEKSRKGLEFFQVCGDPPGSNANPLQRSSTLVAQLVRALTPSQTPKNTFSVEAAIPSSFSEHELDVIRSYIQNIQGYGNVFKAAPGGRQRLAFEPDYLLTSCSSGQNKQDQWLSDCADISGMKPGELANLVVGNLGGYWLPKSGLGKREQKFLDDINARWVGIGLEDINDIAKRGGVILLAFEEYKAEIVMELVERRLISSLLISSQLAKKIKKL